MKKWISANKKLPEEGNLVLVCDENQEEPETFMAFFFPIKKTWAFMDNEFSVTHWMERPKAMKAR
jgi:hypothetical protein